MESMRNRMWCLYLYIRLHSVHVEQQCGDKGWHKSSNEIAFRAMARSWEIRIRTPERKKIHLLTHLFNRF